MSTFLLILHLIFAVALIGVVLMQKSEGGALGIGGGGGFMTARGATNFLTRTTAIVAALFMISSLGLSLLARHGGEGTSLLDRIPVSAPATTTTTTTTTIPAPAPAATGGTSVPAAPSAPSAPSVPTAPAPAAPASVVPSAPVAPAAPAPAAGSTSGH